MKIKQVHYETALITFALITLSSLGFAQDIKDVDYISPFKDGLAAVQKDGNWGFIDESGTLVINFRKHSNFARRR